MNEQLFKQMFEALGGWSAFIALIIALIGLILGWRSMVKRPIRSHQNSSKGLPIIAIMMIAIGAYFLGKSPIDDLGRFGLEKLMGNVHFDPGITSGQTTPVKSKDFTGFTVTVDGKGNFTATPGDPKDFVFWTPAGEDKGEAITGPIPIPPDGMVDLWLHKPDGTNVPGKTVDMKSI